jgi:hypothetical protein
MGAGLGMMLGPWGALLGGALGGAAGYFGLLGGGDAAPAAGGGAPSAEMVAFRDTMVRMDSSMAQVAQHLGPGGTVENKLNELIGAVNNLRSTTNRGFLNMS